MQQAKRVAKNTGYLYAQMGITVFISLYATRLILAALGTEDFGVFSLIAGAIAMLTFLNNAMTTATQRFMSFIHGEGNIVKQKKIFNVSILLHIFIGIIVVILLEIAGYFLFNGILNIENERLYVAKIIFQFMLVSTFFTIISVPYDAVINAHENMLLVAILRIVESILKLAIAFYITYTTYDKLITFGFLMAVLSILLLIVRRIYCHRKYEEVIINIKKYYSKTLFKEMTSFASWSFLGCTTSMVGSYGQGIVLNMFFGTAVNAAQGIALQVRGQLSSLATVVIRALNPMIAKSEGAGNRDLMLKASMLGSKTSFFLLLVLYVPVMLEMPFIFSLWLKKVPEFAIIFCRLLLLRGLIEQLFITLRSAIGAVGNIKKFELFNTPLLILPLIFSWFLFKMGYPPYFLYVVFIIFEIFNSILILFFTNKECGLSIKLYLKEVIFPCISSFLVMGAVSIVPELFMQEGYLRLLLVLFLSTISFLFVVWAIGTSKVEKKEIKKIGLPYIQNFRRSNFFKK